MKKIFMLSFLVVLIITSSINCNQIKGKKPQSVKDVYYLNGNGVQVSVWVKNLNIPWSLVFIDKNTALVSERSGTIRLIKNGKVMNKAYAKIDVVHAGEAGLMGLALHPDFPAQPYVYAMHSYSVGKSVKNRVIRLKHNGSYAKFDKVIIDGLLGAKYHDGGRIKFGPDKMLYICAGEQYVRTRAQNLNVLSGKILRLTPEGKIPSDNPFKNSPVYSYGHRNPQGITWHPKTKDMFQSEHGPSGELGRHKHDEINVIKKGGNYGWPLVIGAANEDKYIDPLVCWTDKATPPGGIAFYKGDLFVATMRSRCLVRIKMKKVNGKYKVTRIEKWFNDGKGNNKFGRLRDVIRGPGGYLYFTTTNRDGRGRVRSGDDKILRLRYK